MELKERELKTDCKNVGCVQVVNSDRDRDSLLTEENGKSPDEVGI